MLVLTRKTQEAVVINDRVFIVPTNLSEIEAILSVYSSEPFDAHTGYELATTQVISSDRKNYVFALKPDECIVIDDDITVIFFVALMGDGETHAKARFGFESTNRTKLQSRERSRMHRQRI